jgi:hypothetical protein
LKNDSIAEEKIRKNAYENLCFVFYVEGLKRQKNAAILKVRASHNTNLILDVAM